MHGEERNDILSLSLSSEGEKSNLIAQDSSWRQKAKKAESDKEEGESRYYETYTFPVDTYEIPPFVKLMSDSQELYYNWKCQHQIII